MNVVLIPESREGEGISFLLLGVLYGGPVVTPELAQSKSCFALGKWRVAFCGKKVIVLDNSDNACLLPHNSSAQLPERCASLFFHEICSLKLFSQLINA